MPEFNQFIIFNSKFDHHKKIFHLTEKHQSCSYIANLNTVSLVNLPCPKFADLPFSEFAET